MPVAPYATFGTPELAGSVLDALDGRSAALMAGHGAIVHAGDLDEALKLALLLEWACTVYWRAAASASRGCSAPRSARRLWPPRSRAVRHDAQGRGRP